MKLFLFLLRASWRTVALAVLTGSVSGLASIGLIALIHAKLHRSDLPMSGLAWGFAGLCLVVLLSRIASQMLLIRLSQGSVQKMSMHLCNRILEAPLRNLEEVGPHRLLTALTGDVGTVAFALNGIPVLCISSVTLFCGMAYLGWLAPDLMVAMVVFLVLGVVSYRAIAALARSYLRRGREDQDTIMRHVRGMMDGIKELKVHHRRRKAFFDKLLTPATKELRDHQITGFSIQAGAVIWGRLLFFVAIGLMLFLWPRLQPVPPAALAGYTLTILYLMSPLEQIMSWLPMMARARISMQAIESLGLVADPTEASLDEVSPATAWCRLDLVGITHAYRRERDGRGFTLGPIDLELEPGELLFVVGGNGSGKTTLAKLLSGLYVPEKGEIRFDGQTVTDDNRETYRQLFTVVFAEVAIFESLLGIDTPDIDGRAQEYLEQLHLDHQVKVNDGVFSTTELSKGQRKRLALLTAYLEDRPIYIFDEWAADQDPLFKDVFYRRILPELKARRKAVIVITHDDRYFDLADRVVTLCDGKVTHGNWELAQALAKAGQPDGIA